MSKQNINLGTAPTGQGGDTPRSAFTKTMANFNEIYAALGGDTLPAAIPVEKGGTGGTTAAAARAGLGLGSAATRTVGTAPNNLLEVGALGLGREYSPGLTRVASVNGYEVGATGFYRYDADTSGRPTFGSGYGSLLQFASLSSGGSNYGSQLAIDYVSNEIGVRSLNANGFTTWRKIYTDGNTTRASDGTLKAI